MRRTRRWHVEHVMRGKSVNVLGLATGAAVGLAAGWLSWRSLWRFVNRWPTFEHPGRAYAAHFALRLAGALALFGGLAACTDGSVAAAALVGFMLARWIRLAAR